MGKKERGTGKQPPDHTIHNIDSNEEAPEIYMIVQGQSGKGRRRFFKNIAGAIGTLSVARLLTSCDNSDYTVRSENGQCTCHVVCSCDSEDGEQEREYDSTYQGGTCTCNTVCTCDSVCTCNSEGGGSCSGCGGGGTYYYPN